MKARSLLGRPGSLTENEAGGFRARISGDRSSAANLHSHVTHRCLFRTARCLGTRLVEQETNTKHKGRCKGNLPLSMSMVFFSGGPKFLCPFRFPGVLTGASRGTETG